MERSKAILRTGKDYDDERYEDKAKELANELIDEMERYVQKQHPEINLDTKAAKEADIESRDYIQPAVICGSDYYELEDWVAEQIKQFIRDQFP